MKWYDAICHAFGTMATGGFSTYNASLGHFASDPNYHGTAIEATVVIFMILAGTNFTLLYLLLLRRPGWLLDFRRQYIRKAVVSHFLTLAGCIRWAQFSQASRDFVREDDPQQAKGSRESGPGSFLLSDPICADYQLALSSEKPCGQHCLGGHQGPEETQSVA